MESMLSHLSAQTLLAIALLVALGTFLFTLLPNTQQRWSHVVTASAVTTVLWILATLLFRVYAQHFGSYNKTHGAIGGVIILLTWMYYTMFVVLGGGELASELHHGTGAVDPEKGAIYLGRIVSDNGPGKASMERVHRSP
jgi:membrane protein